MLNDRSAGGKERATLDLSFDDEEQARAPGSSANRARHTHRARGSPIRGRRTRRAPLLPRTPRPPQFGYWVAALRVLAGGHVRWDATTQTAPDQWL